MKRIIHVGVIGVICLSFFVLQFDIVMSGSMEPLIATGSLAIVDTTCHNVKIGDVIVYSLDRIKVIHRVVDIKEDTYITKGDANEACDLNPVETRQVIGKLIVAIPYLGYILFYWKKYLWMFVIILILWRMKK